MSGWQAAGTGAGFASAALSVDPVGYFVMCGVMLAVIGLVWWVFELKWPKL